jgi:hypothetical protein
MRIVACISGEICGSERCVTSRGPEVEASGFDEIRGFSSGAGAILTSSPDRTLPRIFSRRRTTSLAQHGRCPILSHGSAHCDWFARAEGAARVSIVIPCSEPQARFLQECVNSVLRQTIDGWRRSSSTMPPATPDLDFWISAVDRGIVGEHIAEPSYVCRIHGDSASRNSFLNDNHLTIGPFIGVIGECSPHSRTCAPNAAGGRA